GAARAADGAVSLPGVLVGVIVIVFFHAEDGIRDFHVTGVQTCALPISTPCASSTAVTCRWLRAAAARSRSYTYRPRSSQSAMPAAALRSGRSDRCTRKSAEPASSRVRATAGSTFSAHGPDGCGPGPVVTPASGSAPGGTTASSPTSTPAGIAAPTRRTGPDGTTRTFVTSTTRHAGRSPACCRGPAGRVQAVAWTVMAMDRTVPAKAGVGDTVDTGALAPLGIGPVEETVYRTLLRSPGSTASELAETLALSPVRLRRAVGELERLGLASRTPGAVPKFLPAAPDVGLAALVLDREAQLGRVRTVA